MRTLRAFERNVALITDMTQSNTLDVLDLPDAISRYRAQGWNVLTIRPADDPYEATLQSTDGAIIRLRRTPIVVSRAEASDAGHTGRASMTYRDLIPGRWDGRFIASHIAVPNGGDIPDDVHYHDVTFQFLAVRTGWVDVLYEGQGDTIRMNPGDIVLQPPGIRHRVLATSPGFDIIEIGCPADHLTNFDHEMALPNGVYGDHAWGGQQFVFSTPGDFSEGWDHPGFSSDDSGIGAATNGIVEVRRVRTSQQSRVCELSPFEFRFIFVMDGDIDVTAIGGASYHLTSGDSIALPPVAEATIAHGSQDATLLDVLVPQMTAS
jgi:quercetin dioxygenase-like cupin family protein